MLCGDRLGCVGIADTIGNADQPRHEHPPRRGKDGRIKDLVLITGQLRSGSSAIAEIVHTLGVSVGTSFLAPMAPTYRLEWEDADLSAWMMQFLGANEHKQNDLERKFPGWLRSYLAGRIGHARNMAGIWGVDEPQTIAAKQGVLALYMPEVRDVAKSLDLNVRTISVCRRQSGIDASVKRSFPPSLVAGALALNQKIRDCTPGNAYVHYEWLIDRPSAVVREIAAFLGVTDEDRIADAIDRVKEPTTCTA